MITFTPIGSTLTASIVEGNFRDLERFLREELVNDDIELAQFTRLHVKRFEHGRIVSASTQSLPIIDEHHALAQNTQSVYDLNYRHVDNPQNPLRQISHTMEYLGKPGPSMYWQFQEDAISPVGVTYPDPARYLADYCYSNWLTVPNCSLRVYVPYPCVARLEGSAYFLATPIAVAKYWNDGPGEAHWDINFPVGGDQIAMRWALVADTNPELHADEFANTNPNILDAFGATATRKSWQFVKTKNIHTPLWQKESIDGSVILKGNRWYNFSLKFKGAGTLGYRAGGANPVLDAIYEIAAGALPNYAGGNYQTMPHMPPYEVLWISGALTIEFIYGYGSIVTDTSLILTAPE